MRESLPVFVLLVAMLTPGLAGAKPLCFDMGSDDSAVRDGFVRVTPKTRYTPQQGFGWRETAGLKADAVPASHEWKLNASRGTEQPPSTYPNELTCDDVRSAKANAFLVDVPAGDYVVYVYCGRSQGAARDYFWFDVSAGGVAATVKLPGPYIFEKRALSATVQQAPLAIELRPQTEWVVAGVVVVPLAEVATVGKQLIAPLDNEIYFLPPDVAAKWKETLHVDDRPLPDFSPADRKRAYAIFARHWSEPIYPNTVPHANELNPTLQLFASLGEYEPVTFTVRPLADLRATTVAVEDLRCGGATIPAGNVEIRSVRYMRVRPNYSNYNSWHIAPDVLDRNHPLDLKQDVNQTYWLTVRVPDDATPGVYEGRVTFGTGTAAGSIPLKVRVLPIRLQKNPAHIYSIYYRDPLGQVQPGNWPAANDYFRRKAELERQDMVAHGLNSHTSNVGGLTRDETGRWSIDGDETDRRIALDRKYGLADRPLVASFAVEHWYTRLVDKQGLGSHLRLVRSDVPQSFFDEVTKMVETIEAERTRRGWPELLYYPIDEPSTHEAAVQFMVGVLKAIKRVPGVRTYVTADPSHDQFAPMWPYVDVWCCQPFVFDHDKIQRLSREKNIEFWCYPNHISGENDHTPVRGARMTWGFGFWRSGFKTLVPWIYQASTGDPLNYLDGATMDFFNRSTADGEPVPVMLWEAFREGIDDGRYIYTLDQLAATAERRGGKAAETAAAARRELKSVWDAIVVQEKYKYDGLWSGPDFDAYRWLLATKIIELQETLK